MPIISQTAPTGGPRPFDPVAFAYQVVDDSLSQDFYMEMLERRIAVLEEIAAARPLARMVLAARIARRLRRSVAPYGWAGPSFMDRRHEAIATDGLAAEL